MAEDTGARHRRGLAAVVGEDAVRSDETTLLDHCRDWWSLSTLQALQGRLSARPLCVVNPLTTEQVAATLRYANRHRLAVVPFGAGSGVCGGVLPGDGAVVVDLRRMNRILELNEVALTVRVQAGMMGGEFEAALNKAGYSMRHFPLSIDVSTVGGWVATRAAGQYSTRYGCIEDVVAGLEAVLADGSLVRTRVGPRSATGPDVRQIFLGAEGSLGIVTELTVRMIPLPESTVTQAIGFSSVHDGLEAIRLFMRAGWRPPVVRLYDAIETARLFPDASTGSNCALLLLSEGPRALAEAESDACAAICAEQEGTPLGSAPVERWLEERNQVPTLESFIERGLVLDTIEVATTWDHIHDLYREVIAALQQVPGLLVASGHSSHSYAQGTNIYFTFVARPESAEEAEPRYLQCWEKAMEATLRCHGTISHHHGIGRLRMPWMERELGGGLTVLRRLKQALDPHGIMNPGVLIPD
jgi:alkyldihydroxyacetonephosphate synthase